MAIKKDKKPLLICITDNEYKAIKRRFTVTNSEENNAIVIEHGFWEVSHFLWLAFLKWVQEGVILYLTSYLYF